MDQVTKEVFALKQMQKARIVKTGQQRNVCNEKRLLAATEHPYVRHATCLVPPPCLSPSCCVCVCVLFRS